MRWSAQHDRRWRIPARMVSAHRLDHLLPAGAEMTEMLLGLPYLRGPLLAKARDLGAPVLVSANAFSRWTEDTFCRLWRGFRVPDVDVVASLAGCCLDSAGFVAARKYGGFPWTVDNYLDLCASAPWTWFAAMDWCVEPEIAADNGTVLDRISGTVRLNIQCINGARERGIVDRLVPVIQGWEVHHYLRCLDRMAGFLDGFSLLGVGSMCRRPVEGQTGILQVVDALDRALPAGVQLHLFGLKSAGMEEVRDHPRIASVDSQAYGVRARQIALEQKRTKTEVFVAGVMAKWYVRQCDRLARPGFAFRDPTQLLPLLPGRACGDFEKIIEVSSEELRELHESGEIDWQGVNQRWAYEMSGLYDN
jgi:hypothetical protein